MKSTETYLPRAVVVYMFVSPNQRLVRWTYAAMKAAKKVWHPTRLIAGANTKLQPWHALTDWYGCAQGGFNAHYRVEPTASPVLRYQGGDEVPSADIARAEPYKRRRHRRYKEEQPREHTAGRRMRHQQRLDEDEPRIRPCLRVQRLYYEDGWVVRDTDRSWKKHRKTQWRE